MPSGVSEVVPAISSPVWPSSVAVTVEEGGAGVGGLTAGEFTVKVKLVVLVAPPPVLVTVIVEVPAGVEAAVAMVKVREQVGLQDVDVV